MLTLRPVAFWEHRGGLREPGIAAYPEDDWRGEPMFIIPAYATSSADIVNVWHKVERLDADARLSIGQAFA